MSAVKFYVGDHLYNNETIVWFLLVYRYWSCSYYGCLVFGGSGGLFVQVGLSLLFWLVFWGFFVVVFFFLILQDQFLLPKYPQLCGLSPLLQKPPSPLYSSYQYQQVHSQGQDCVLLPSPLWDVSWLGCAQALCVTTTVVDMRFFPAVPERIVLCSLPLPLALTLSPSPLPR